MGEDRAVVPSGLHAIKVKLRVAIEVQDGKESQYLLEKIDGHVSLAGRRCRVDRDSRSGRGRCI